MTQRPISRGLCAVLGYWQAGGTATAGQGREGSARWPARCSVPSRRPHGPGGGGRRPATGPCRYLAREPRRAAPLPARASGSPSAPWRLRQNPQSVRILQPAPLPGPTSSASVTPASLLPTRSPTSGPQVCCSLHLRPLPRPCHVATAQTRPATPGAAQALGGPSPLPRPRGRAGACAGGAAPGGAEYHPARAPAPRGPA